MLSLAFVLFVCIVAVLAPWVAPHSFHKQNMDKILLPAGKNAAHVFGTDSLGRDVLSRVIYGARISMAVGVLAALISFLLGTLYGGISGWVGGKVDALMMRIVDSLFAIPTLVLLILVKMTFDSFELFSNPELNAVLSVLMALSVFGWLMLARVVRGQVMQIKQEVYIEASKALGVGSLSILARHVFPNMLGPVIVLLTVQIPSNTLFESFLSFIGLGLQPPYSSWGVLARGAWEAFPVYPHLMALSPGVWFFLTMLAFNFLGDGLRDAFDPKA